MMLPYSVEVLFAAMARYNAAWFPAPLVGVILAVVGLALAMLPTVVGERMAGRVLAALLALFSVWIGAVHQLQHMAPLNFMAPVYAAAWILQGALFALAALLGQLRFDGAASRRRRAGLAIAVFAVAGYPLAVRLSGQPWSALPWVGTAPDPTAIFIAGLLLTATGRARLWFMLVPLAWAGVAGMSAALLDFPLDYTVPAAVACAGVGMVIGGRYSARRGSH